MPDRRLSRALENKASSERVQKLLLLDPKAVKVLDGFGRLPLHYALCLSASSSVINMLLQAYPKAAEVADYNGSLPLHYALHNKALYDVINLLLKAYPKAIEVPDWAGYLPFHSSLMCRTSSDVIKMLLQAYPHAAEVQAQCKFLPLHTALYKKSSSDIIQVLFKAYPKSVMMKTEYETIPLHYACKSEFYLCDGSLEVLNLLVSAYPEGIDVQDIDGKIPSYYLKREAKFFNGTEYLYLLHNVVKAGSSIHLVKFLLQAFPQSCRTEDNYGMVPLHYACAIRATNHLEVVMTLLDADENSKNIKDNRGRTSMQILQCTASHPDGNKMFPLHRLAANSDSLTEKSLLLLFNAYPESIRSSDKYGMLPFYHSCLNQALSLEVLMLFVSLYPEAVNEVQAIVDDKNVAKRPSKRKKK